MLMYRLFNLLLQWKWLHFFASSHNLLLIDVHKSSSNFPPHTFLWFSLPFAQTQPISIFSRPFRNELYLVQHVYSTCWTVSSADWWQLQCGSSICPKTCNLDLNEPWPARSCVKWREGLNFLNFGRSLTFGKNSCVRRPVLAVSYLVFHFGVDVRPPCSSRPLRCSRRTADCLHFILYDRGRQFQTVWRLWRKSSLSIACDIRWEQRNATLPTWTALDYGRL